MSACNLAATTEKHASTIARAAAGATAAQAAAVGSTTGAAASRGRRCGRYTHADAGSQPGKTCGTNHTLCRHLCYAASKSHGSSSMQTVDAYLNDLVLQPAACNDWHASCTSASSRPFYTTAISYVGRQRHDTVHMTHMTHMTILSTGISCHMLHMRDVTTRYPTCT